MKALSIIVGILSMIAGVFCICYKGSSVVLSGFILTAILIIAGIVNIVGYAKGKSDAKKGNFNAVAPGVGSLVFGIIALVFSIIALFSPSIQLSLGIIMVILFAVWLIFQGISSIILAVQMKKMCTDGSWVAMLIMGILLTLVAILAATNFFATMFAADFMLGFLFMTFGINLMCTPDDQNPFNGVNS